MQRTSLNALLRLPETSEYQQATDFGLTFFNKAVSYTGRNIKFDTKVNIPFKEVSFKLEDVEVFDKYFTNPLYRILSLTPVEEIYDLGQLPRIEICGQLCRHESLAKLCQLTILSSTLYKHEEWISSLSEAWLSQYPEGNTITVNFSPL